ncbi:hypothetical protein MYX07_00320 [Patescibacteria group bacterium AH-259-L07]|nr:hypothetical protein [Patescibacteria group bacterium AH-259-L07]
MAKSKSYYVVGMTYEDLAQELRTKLIEVADRYDESRGSMRTFAHIVMWNHIKDLIKKSKREKRKIDSYHLSLTDFERKV